MRVIYLLFIVSGWQGAVKANNFLGGEVINTSKLLGKFLISFNNTLLVVRRRRCESGKLSNSIIATREVFNSHSVNFMANYLINIAFGVRRGGSFGCFGLIGNRWLIRGGTADGKIASNCRRKTTFRRSSLRSPAVSEVFSTLKTLWKVSLLVVFGFSPFSHSFGHARRAPADEKTLVKLTPFQSIAKSQLRDAA